jgi:hypothetical protein
MTSPDTNDIHVNALLTNLSIGYMQDEANFVADRVFPIVMVDKQSDLYAVYNKDAWFRDHGDAMRRAPGNRAVLTGWSMDSARTYMCQNEAIGTYIPDELRWNADAVFNLDADATRLVTHAQLIRRERLFVTRYMTSGVWTTQKTGTTDFIKWSDYANSNPFLDIENWKNAVRTLIGRMPNKLVIGELTWRRLKNHPQLLNRVSGGATVNNPALLTRQMVAGWFELDEILVDYATYNSAGEGATPVLQDIVSDSGLLIYVPSTPGLLVPAAGYTFVWRPAVNGNAIQYIRKYREEAYKRDVIEAYSYFDQVVTAPDAGVYLADIVD